MIFAYCKKPIVLIVLYQNLLEVGLVKYFTVKQILYIAEVCAYTFEGEYKKGAHSSLYFKQSTVVCLMSHFHDDITRGFRIRRQTAFSPSEMHFPPSALIKVLKFFKKTLLDQTASDSISGDHTFA